MRVAGGVGGHMRVAAVRVARADVAALRPASSLSVAALRGNGAGATTLGVASPMGVAGGVGGRMRVVTAGEKT
jgi:hypothetical protein